MKPQALFFVLICFLAGLVSAEQCAKCSDHTLDGPDSCSTDLPTRPRPVSIDLQCRDLNVEITLANSPGVRVQTFTLDGATDKCPTNAEKNKISGAQDECFEKKTLTFNEDQSCFALSGNVTVVQHISHGDWDYVVQSKVNVSCCVFVGPFPGHGDKLKPSNYETAACEEIEFVVAENPLGCLFSWTVAPHDTRELLESDPAYHAELDDEVDWYVDSCTALDSGNGADPVPLVVNGGIELSDLTGSRYSATPPDAKLDYFEYSMQQFAMVGQTGKIKVGCGVKLCAKNDPSSVKPYKVHALNQDPWRSTPLSPCSLYFNAIGNVKPFTYRRLHQ